MAHPLDLRRSGTAGTRACIKHSGRELQRCPLVRGSGRVLSHLFGILVVLGAVSGCKRAEPEATRAGALSPEPELFAFSLPSEYAPLELHGEGSETMRAPPGATVSAVAAVYRVQAGPDFVLDIQPEAATLAELKSRVPGQTVVFEEPDVLIFKASAGYQFVVVRELVPQWDETDRRRFSCAGGASPFGAPNSPAPARADAPGYSRSSLQKMVAACRSLDLPQLE